MSISYTRTFTTTTSVQRSHPLSTPTVVNTQTWPKVLSCPCDIFYSKRTQIGSTCPFSGHVPQCLSVWRSSSVFPWFCALYVLWSLWKRLCVVLLIGSVFLMSRLSVSARTSQKDAGCFFCIPLGGSIICVLLLMEHWVKEVSTRLPHHKVFFFPFAISNGVGRGDFLRVISYFHRGIQPLALAPDDSWLNITTVVVMEGCSCTCCEWICISDEWDVVATASCCGSQQRCLPSSSEAQHRVGVGEMLFP